MTRFSRRQLANYAVEALLADQKPSALAKHLAAGLITAGRQKEIGLLLSDIELEFEDRGLQTQARVTSAHSLTDKLKSEIEREIKKMTDSEEVIISAKVDKSVVGGVKIETANHTWDRTFKRTLNDIRKSV